MTLKNLTEYLNKIKEFNFLLEEVRKGQDNLIYGTAGSQRSMLTALMVGKKYKSLLYIVESPQRGKEVFDDLNNLLPEYNIHYFPALDLLPFEVIARSHETQRKRIEVMNSLINGGNNVVITTLEALKRNLVPPELFKQAIFTFKVGETFVIEELLRLLIDAGYQRVDMVEDKGQISLRGGIMDIFPATAEKPYRLEFFDDELDSIRVFSIENQRSVDKIDEVTIPPASEFFLLGFNKEDAIQRIEKEAEHVFKAMKRAGNQEGYDSLIGRINEIKEYFTEGNIFPGYEQFLPYFSKEKISLVNYFIDQPMLVMEEPNRQRESAALREKETEETYKVLLGKGKLMPGQLDNYLRWEEIWQHFMKIKKVYFSLLPKKPLGISDVNLLSIAAKTPNLFLGKTQLLADELKEWRRQKFVTIIQVNSRERIERLKQTLWDLGIEAIVADDSTTFQPQHVYITKGYLSGGFELTNWKIAFLTEQELYHQPKKRSPRKMFKEGKKVTVLEDLKIGDYVVHTNHGIGRYMGIEKLSVGDAERDYLVIKYHGEDKLYVPTDQAGLLQKYFNQEGHAAPKLSKLGGNEWNKVKSKVKAAVKDMADDLLKLYAARQAQQGFAFSPDTPWQKEFEEAFPFEETPDQLRAIEEVKGDMEKSRPMDRLLCGDVGYGKTEVAVRAAFKAVMDGKQVAVLVPTTVLAQQHYNTFRERFEGFPVNINVISRFRSVKEQKKTIKDLKTGQVDVVIGTHRLLSSDVKFKDLGLLIVDEEQRFGVAHKEKIKKLKKTVDVLTLTATPIPRTLHMSLVGVRDMSIIETPPEDRYPVQTYVVEYSEQLVREAIRRELGRGGQVYFVHNRVEDIDKVAAFIQDMVPEGRIGIGHGRMTEDQLEKVMLDFMEGKLDILVCTTIIETGLDISNVNTLIIDNADKMGLAQLYQLRGRVGRSNRVAYAYLTYSKDKILSEVAEKRLNAIREFTELGSGFKIAMRDLEIRGSGNILGAEQHGHVAAVGFDLYCRMLEEAVKQAKGEEIKTEKPVNIDLKIKAYIPQEYISDTGVKIDFYQRIYGVKDKEEINLLEEEMEDRFGDIPGQLANLLKIAVIKATANAAKINAITQENEVIKIKMDEDHGLLGPQLMRLVRQYRRQVSFSTSKGLEILVNINNLDKKQVLSFLEELIMEISSIAQYEEALI